MAKKKTSSTSSTSSTSTASPPSAPAKKRAGGRRGKTTRARTQAGRKKAFLEDFANHGNQTLGAETAGVDRRTVTRWRHDDPDFAQAFERAHEDSVDILIAEARRRGLEGTEKPVFQGGKQVGKVREFSDVLLIFLIKGGRPEVYRERYEFRHSGKVETVDRTLAEAISADPEARQLAADLLRRARDPEPGSPSDDLH